MGKIILNGTSYAGSGGGGGGHTIVDPDGTSMPQETKLQFTGNVSVSDDSANGQTVVDVEGGGNAYGVFIDTDNVIISGTYDTSLSYTATEDCFIVFDWVNPNNNSTKMYINGEDVFEAYQSASIGAGRTTLPLKKGQTLTGTTTYSSTKNYTVYGIQSGSISNVQHNYSTNEQVIGTWIDGKPLYQKTVVLNNLSVTNNQWAKTNESATNIKMIADGFLIDNQSPSQTFQCDIGVDGGKIAVLTWFVGNSTRTMSYLTFRYTKTTD